jgi:putative endonuclease
MPKESCWLVYILRCSDRTLYTGVTTDPVRRLKQHNAGTGARYTRARLPVTLVYLEEAAGRGEALKREHAIKKLTRSQKLGLIKKYSSPIKNQNGLKD